jgi:hypothetical protein
VTKAPQFVRIHPMTMRRIHPNRYDYRQFSMNVVRIELYYRKQVVVWWFVDLLSMVVVVAVAVVRAYVKVKRFVNHREFVVFK